MPSFLSLSLRSLAIASIASNSNLLLIKTYWRMWPVFNWHFSLVGHCSLRLEYAAAAWQVLATIDAEDACLANVLGGGQQRTPGDAFNQAVTKAPKVSVSLNLSQAHSVQIKTAQANTILVVVVLLIKENICSSHLKEHVSFPESLFLVVTNLFSLKTQYFRWSNLQVAIKSNRSRLGFEASTG